MNTKSLAILGVVTGVVILGAVVVRLSESRSGATTRPERLIPRLEERINDVARIVVRDVAQEVVLERRDGQWVAATQGGYPVRFAPVKELLISLAEARPAERKTSDPTLYSRIGVVHPEEGGSGLLVALEDEAGERIAAVVLGEQTQAGRRGARFVRLADEETSWLVEGRFAAWSDPMRWIDRQLIRIPRERMQRVTIEHPDGEVLEVVRPGAAAKFELADMPEGRELNSPGELNRVTNALLYVDFTDVRSVADHGLALSDEVVATYVTQNGLEVVVHTWEVDGRYWAAFEVGTRAAEQESEEGGADVESEAQELAEKIEGWLFQLSESKARSFRLRANDLTKVPEESAEGGSGQD